VRFTAERDAARAAVTAFHVDVRLVDEAGHPLRLGGDARILGKALQSGDLGTESNTWVKRVLPQRPEVDARGLEATAAWPSWSSRSCFRS
jgi:hypothetical protein